MISNIIKTLGNLKSIISIGINFQFITFKSFYKLDEFVYFTGTDWVWEIIHMLIHGKTEYRKEDKTATMLEIIPTLRSLESERSPRNLNTHLPVRWLPSEHLEKGGTCKLRNGKKRKETKRNGKKKNEKKTRRKATKRNEKKRNAKKRKQNSEKRNETKEKEKKRKKRKETKRNEKYGSP